MDLDGEVPELRALATHFADQGGALWVAERDGAIIGMVGTHPLPEAGDWELCRMYVAAQARGRGVADDLLRVAEDHARAAGATRMRLWSDTRFARAHAFYEGASYLRSGPIRALDDLSHSIEYGYAKPLRGIALARLDAAGAASAERALTRVLVECVDKGASVSFMPPLDRVQARAFWRRMASQVATGDRVLVVAWADGVLAGCVMLDLGMPPNQPHRADLQKLLVAPWARRRGVARLLMAEIEAEAVRARRRLVVLDTAAGSGAEPLYRELGWTECGVIPDFALAPDGASTWATVLFYKRF